LICEPFGSRGSSAIPILFTLGLSLTLQRPHHQTPSHPHSACLTLLHPSFLPLVQCFPSSVLPSSVPFFSS
jgi:hypothetical protein